MSDQQTTIPLHVPPGSEGPADFLRARGHTVEAGNIPGLYRVNGGPEVTAGQLWSIAYREANRG
jgi:hypothetical protein